MDDETCNAQAGVEVPIPRPTLLPPFGLRERKELVEVENLSVEGVLSSVPQITPPVLLVWSSWLAAEQLRDEMAREVVVAEVVVELTAVKFCSVDDPRARRLPACTVPVVVRELPEPVVK